MKEALREVASRGAAGITCAGKTDGGGAQIIAAMSAILFSRITGIPYYHTPLKKVMFSEGPDWADRWERFFNIGLGENRVTPDIPVSTWDNQTKDSVIAFPHFHPFIHEQNAQSMYEGMRPEFLAKYNSSPKPDVERGHVAVHVRRSDVEKDGRYARRYTDDIDIITAVQSVQRGRNVHFFSQKEGFGDFKSIENAKYFLDHDVFESIHRMVCADALVMARSTMSYVAGILNPSEVIYDPWFHKPLPRWKKMVISSRS